MKWQGRAASDNQFSEPTSREVLWQSHKRRRLARVVSGESRLLSPDSRRDRHAVGYEGGNTDNPTYQDVCSHTTGHAEAVEVDYDPERVTYEELLKVFWENHDPTQFNRQGPDVGDQYRTVIFYHTAEQEAAAIASKAQLEQSGSFASPLSRRSSPPTTFYSAEDYHQQYLEKRGLSTCKIG